MSNQRFSVTINQNAAHPVVVLKDHESNCWAEVFAFGGLLNRFQWETGGKKVQVIKGYASVAEARQKIAEGFNSAKLSPFVCRMRNGQYSWQGQKRQVHKHFLGKHAIHGLVYDLPYQIKESHADATLARVGLSAQYKKTDQGYPHSFSIQLIWTLSADQTLTITTLVQHQEPQTIPYADGWHPYFSLGNKVDNCRLQFNARRQLVFDAELLPTKKEITNESFLRPLSLKGKNLDNSFLFEPGTEAKCVLSNAQWQLDILPGPEYPVLQVYTPMHRNSIAIENLSGAPDNFNNGIGLLSLEPNKEYAFTTRYRLSKVKQT
ncbi:MAG: aldose 1-epimerase [Sphingobacteriia bacterium]|nr:MAG: aldose 1-epimerase [Sphingobacteriia bacterium]